MENRFKYAPTPSGTRRCVHLRKFQDPFKHELWYSFLKHRAQARFRGETYRLTWQNWQQIWTPALWAKRGRGPRSLRLAQKNPKLGWSLKNCEVVEHSSHMRKINLARTEAKKHNAGSI
jgi:hypothetical protein